MYNSNYPHKRPTTKREFKEARDIMSQQYQSNDDNNDYRFAVNPETPRGEKREEAISLKDWLITLLISAIPFVGVIALLYWAFGNSSEVPRSKSNYAKASLIVYAVLVILFVIIYISFLGALINLIN
ncbi:MAG: hypothetical protein LBF12_01055 [Christensenellaceae bacterium]|jgi:hypothetical protein|nr:hypothetical protein [Christensenellaceae bacterium]